MTPPTEITIPIQIVTDLHWMARRYADWRCTFAPATVNRITRYLLAQGVELNNCDGTIWARDGMWPRCTAGLSVDEYNMGGHDREGQMWQDRIREATAGLQAEVERLREALDDISGIYYGWQIGVTGSITQWEHNTKARKALEGGE